jgi:hypothetical protein
MRFRAILLALPWTAIMAPASVWAASVGEKWEAVSTTAMAITGDLIFSPDRSCPRNFGLKATRYRGNVRVRSLVEG